MKFKQVDNKILHFSINNFIKISVRYIIFEKLKLITFFYYYNIFYITLASENIFKKNDFFFCRFLKIKIYLFQNLIRLFYIK